MPLHDQPRFASFFINASIECSLCQCQRHAKKVVSMVLSQHGFLAPTRPSTKPSQGNQHLEFAFIVFTIVASEDLPGSQCLLHCAVSCTAALSCPVCCIALPQVHTHTHIPGQIVKAPIPRRTRLTTMQNDSKQAAQTVHR